MINRIIIATDCSDIAFNEMYGSLVTGLSELGSDIPAIDPVVAIEPFSVVNAAFAVRLIAEVCTAQTLLIVVANAQPNSPARIFGKTKAGHWFIGNNSGYFNWILKDFGIDELYENVTDRDVDGRSFGGKHVQIPTAIKLITGSAPSAIGKPLPLARLSTFQIPDGSVLHCDNFGLMKIMHQSPMGLNPGDIVDLQVNGVKRCEAVYTDKMKLLPDGTWALYRGSSLGGLPELGCVRRKASASLLGVHVGDIISWRKAGQ